ncbi:MAG: endonuclease [Cyanobacteriota bacterium]|nr:endonuclease [Cyanobacteriota bacterium]
MLPDRTLLQETIERYQERSSTRENHLHQLASANLLNVDTPERIDQRLERIARARTATAVGDPNPPNLSEPAIKRILLERLLGQKDLMNVSYLESGLSRARSVCRLILRDRNRRIAGYGTGFLVSPHLLLTNNHVLPNPQQAQNALAEFNYQSNPDGQLLPSIVYSLDPETFFLTQNHLDYSLVALQESQELPPPKELGWNPLIEEQGKVLIGEYVSIIQHPGGEPKQLALRENRVIDLLEHFLHYQTDTAPGSSGSPVFNDQWEVVGLHHSGVPKTDSQGNLLSLDGRIWTPAMGEDRLDWLANEGTRISRIIQDLKARSNLNPQQRQLRSELLEGPPPPRTSPRSEIPSLEKPAISPMPVVEAGVATWTIPLQLSVRLGATGIVSPNQPEPVVPSPAVEEPPGDRPIESPFPPPDTDPQFRQAWQQLERVRRGEIPYYDACQDESERNAYYSQLPGEVESLTPEELFERLHRLLEETHQQHLAYKPSRHLYPWVDLQPNLNLRSLYSHLEYTPERLAREDLSIERERTARLREMMLRESLSSEQLEERIVLLEKQLPYNCEHVVPQSWFSKRQPMRGDLHHLFACEARCNSFRGNFPYTDFADFGETVRSDCGKSAGRKFEPGFGKGEAARATLYFLLRYPGWIDDVNREYTSESLGTLLEWHRDYPVTVRERHRNRAIYRKQGNRNPAIDFPQWVEKIDFRRALG